MRSFLSQINLLFLSTMTMTNAAPNCEKSTFCYFPNEHLSIRAAEITEGFKVEIKSWEKLPVLIRLTRNGTAAIDINCDPSNLEISIRRHIFLEKSINRVDGPICETVLSGNGLSSSDKLTFQLVLSNSEIQTSPEFTIDSLKNAEIPTEAGLSKHQRRQFSKAHAILMIVGWLFFVPTGFLFARFGRDLYEGQTLFGMAVWFQIHRVCNFLGVICICSSMICIFISQQWTWKGTGSGSKYWTEVHTDLGVISTFLAILQPINSWFRCGPTHSKRPIFNWSHRIIGILSYSIAATTIIIAAINFRRIWNEPILELVLVNLPTILCLGATILFPILEGQGKRKNAYGINRAESEYQNKYKMDQSSLLLPASSISDNDNDIFDTNAKPRQFIKTSHILPIPFIFWSVGIFFASVIALSLLIINGYKNA